MITKQTIYRSRISLSSVLFFLSFSDMSQIQPTEHPHLSSIQFHHMTEFSLYHM